MLGQVSERRRLHARGSQGSVIVSIRKRCGYAHRGCRAASSHTGSLLPPEPSRKRAAADTTCKQYPSRQDSHLEGARSRLIDAGRLEFPAHAVGEVDDLTQVRDHIAEPHPHVRTAVDGSVADGNHLGHDLSHTVAAPLANERRLG